VDCRTKEETAEYLQLNRELILQLFEDGTLRAVEDGDVIKIRRSDLERLIESGELPVSRGSN
jgi:excisionase family DNA binding protein